MGTTIDGTSSSVVTYKPEEPKTEGPPPEVKPRSFLEKATAWAEAGTQCVGALAPPPVGMLATFIAERAKGASNADAAGWAGVKSFAEGAVHLLAEGAGGPMTSGAIQTLACVEEIKSAATGESDVEAAVQGKLAGKVLDANTVSTAATAAMAQGTK